MPPALPTSVGCWEESLGCALKEKLEKVIMWLLPGIRPVLRLTMLTSFNPHRSPKGYELHSAHEEMGAERWVNLPRATALESGGAGVDSGECGFRIF